MSICRLDNWNIECENIINKQINIELTASYIYQQLFSFFNKDNLSLNNIANYFNKCSLEEREHAEAFIKYQNKRGGNIIFDNIIINNFNLNNLCDDNSSILIAFEKVLELEQYVYECLKNVHVVANKHNDTHLVDYIESEFFTEQIDVLNEIANYISKLRRINDNGLGIIIFDKDIIKV
tara:strand:+ start:5686 stop:6222 length:537 start_codon:yes stop_codon:yes gene_type:complete